MKLPWLVVVLGWASAGCTARSFDVPEAVGRTSAGITHGATDTGDDAVVAIVGAPGTTGCSGTVVAPHLVLTAGHCTVPLVVQGGRVVFGPSLAGATSSIPIARAVAHPRFDLATLTNDVGVLVLSSAAPAAPVAMGSGAPASGSTVRIVGWGLTGD
ncbi:MAG TPA: trypsin-like serine protease, partial [Polyangiaceae bacterium]|nr:trypsin-like serine protease [Polyangiaceae bacterium]